MAVPKRRKSHARVRTRRANWKAAPVTTTICPHCGATSLPHRVCTTCGYYKDRQVLPIRTRQASAETGEE